MISIDTERVRSSVKEHTAPVLVLLLGCAIQAFGLYHIHSFSGVTEGGVLGATLLLEHHFCISPAVTSFVMNALCYLFGWRTLGRRFIVYSLISCAGFSLFYALFEGLGWILPHAIYQCLQTLPWTAAIAGAVFIGVGAGLCVRVGGAPSGDDALAMGLSRVTGLGIQWIYLGSDLLVLGLSVTYLSWERLFWSLVSVILSGQIIGWVQKIPLPQKIGGRTTSES
ncbi:MAG: YitT family protein [Ruminococcaceae bacterium]|nr:YitT family protein [Oscillospiraceae bacterium]